jgi:DNA invertase Pin-like site-specific DNA recombinase
VSCSAHHSLSDNQRDPRTGENAAPQGAAEKWTQRQQVPVASRAARTAGRTKLLGLESYGYPEKEKELVYRAYRERGSKRAISRIFGVSRNTLTRWLNKQQLERDAKPSQ